MVGVLRAARLLAVWRNRARRCARARLQRVALGACLAGLSACGGGLPAIAPAAMPHDAYARRASLVELGKELFEGLRGGALRACFASQNELEALIVPEARFRLERERAASVERVDSAAVFQRDWALASYAGFCAQGAREELAQSSLGLTRPGWVLDRILVVADLGQGRARSASWLEGAFVYTEHGWKALSFRRIEQPRSHHADLELAPCDVESGLR
jgi:hypothetical protein